MLQKISRPLYILLIFSLCHWASNVSAQNKIEIDAVLDDTANLITIEQKIKFFNTSEATLNSIILNDWNHAYSDKNSPLGKRFSDEFVRSFHRASDAERGFTYINKIINEENTSLSFTRLENHLDLVEVHLNKELAPGDSTTIFISYQSKIPNEKFTRIGFDNKGNFILKNWYLSICRLEKSDFVFYSNENLNDIANQKADFKVNLKLNNKLHLFTNLNIVDRRTENNQAVFNLEGQNLLDFDLNIEKNPTYFSYKSDHSEIVSNLKDRKLNEIQKALVIDQVSRYVSDYYGVPVHSKILISQLDYDLNPFYGLNQLPAFISPFSDSFLYELKFLKVYSEKYLNEALNLNPRKDTWIFDGLQAFLMMQYIKDNYPDMKMMGNLSEFGILKGYNIFKADFNDQYYYVYLLMARKNLDQAIGDNKDTFIKFNEKIAGKYRSGMSFNYLNDYLGGDKVRNSIQEFVRLNHNSQTDESDLEKILKKNSDKDIDWFFRTVVETRDLIDFKITKLNKTKEHYYLTLRNKTHADVPVSLYGLKKDSVISKIWVDNFKKDTIIVLPKTDVEKFVLNYHFEIPEHNARNNWKRVNSFLGNNRPFKFTFIKDLEDSKRNQIFYVPELSYNYYDGISPGLSFHNKSLLNKPFIFDITPIYSSKTKELIGGAFFSFNQNVREEKLYNIRYSFGGNTYHYAPNASYYKIVPSITFRFRDPDYRKNLGEAVTIRHVIVEREKSIYASENDENYSVFNIRYSKLGNEIQRLFAFSTDVQIAANFGKLAGEIQYRRLFDNNRQINLRLYAGTFMYRSTDSEFFSFGIDTPTDYLFDYGILGRSESSGIFSQQYIMAEGGFKSKFDTRYANQWLTSFNGSFNIWNWIEVYGDMGLFKNDFSSTRFIYDSGLRLNLLPDYFELYFPVYSSNGWEISQKNYDEKIRFVITLSPKTLISLFTRKWF